MHSLQTIALCVSGKMALGFVAQTPLVKHVKFAAESCRHTDT